MKKRRAISEVQAHFRLFLVFAIILGAIIGLIVLIARMRGGTISNETLTFERDDVQVVIIRDEKTKLSEAVGKILYFADEGQQVKEGDKVAEVYQRSYNKNVYQDLMNLQRQIKQYQKQTILKDVVNEPLSELDNKIKVKTQEIADEIRLNGSEDLLVLQRELDALLKERQTMLRNTTQPDVKLNDLYESENGFIESLNKWKADAVASQDGSISFYFDGYEPLLNTETIEQLTPEDINTVFRQQIPSSVLSKTERPLFRLVRNDVWYIAIATEKREDLIMFNGSEYTLNFHGFYDKEYKGRVVFTKKGADRDMYVLQINDDVSEFLSLRTAKVDIKSEFSGISVPYRSIVREKDKNQDSIYIDNGDELSLVPIDIVVVENGKAIIQSKEPSAALAEGMRYENR